MSRQPDMDRLLSERRQIGHLADAVRSMRAARAEAQARGDGDDGFLLEGLIDSATTFHKNAVLCAQRTARRLVLSVPARAAAERMPAALAADSEITVRDFAERVARELAAGEPGGPLDQDRGSDRDEAPFELGRAS